MSEIITPVLTDRTFKTALDKQNQLLGLIAGKSVIERGTYEQIRDIVRAGLAPSVFKIGDQITVKWKNYTVPLDIVHFGSVELEDGSIVPGMFLQWHFATLTPVQFDAVEAFYVAPAGGLAAGTYYITSTVEWSNIKKQSYQFTLSKPLPAGGQIAFSVATIDSAFANWRIYTYATADSMDAIEGPITPIVGTTGTCLGEWNNTTLYGQSGINHLQRSAAGYNRWSQSAYRQYLNSGAPANAWWTAQNPYDRAPQQLATTDGFMNGFDSEFLAVLSPVKVKTYLNTTTDKNEGIVDCSNGTYEITYDTWFQASLEQEYINPQVYGEGSAWKYWKERLGTPSPQAQYAATDAHIRYAIENQTSPQNCRLRSAYRSNAYKSWYTTTAGYANISDSYSAYRCAPACVIC